MPGGSQRPALMPTEVWMHLRNGELWMATLNRLRFLLDFGPVSEIYSAPVVLSVSSVVDWVEDPWYSASASVMMFAILPPSVLAWSHPP